jgi:methionyl-tRNA formyltransferase
MNVVLLCATRRGRLFVDTVARVLPGACLIVVSFPEEPWEPPFLDDIRQAALAHGGEFYQARQVGSPSMMAVWDARPIDLMVAVSWRYYVPPAVFRRARLGAYVFHDSLLPKYRGFAPTVWAMINGEPQTGVSLIEMGEGIDEGDIIAQAPVAIGPDVTIATVLENVTQAYLDMAGTHIPALAGGNVARHPQDHSAATYCCKRLPEDNWIDWTAPTQRIYDLIRATTAPYPGAFTTLNQKTLRIWSAERTRQRSNYVGRVPGRVVAVQEGRGVEVLTGDGQILITRVQLDGEPAVPAVELLSRLSTTLGR